MINKFKINNKFQTILLIAILLVISAFLRFYNLNWDQGNYFHPDERNIANAVSRIQFFSQMDPQFFAYGGFSIYLYRFAAEITSTVSKDISWISEWGKINIIGRFFSALFSTITLVPLYFLAKKIADKKTAILSIIFYAFCVTSIQTAHYAVTESLITLIGVTLCLLTLINYKKITLLNSLASGIIFGIGIATKTSALSFAIIPLTAYLLKFFENKKISEFIKIIINVFIFTSISLVVFIIFSPFTFIDWGKFMESMRYESGVATGYLPVVYTLQFDHTIPYFFQLYNLFWQIGFLALFAITGFIYLFIEFIKKRNKQILIFIIFPLLYFLYVGSWHTKFIRYMVPIIPFLLISASIILFKFKSKFRLTGKLLIIFIIFATIAWSMAFFTIYLRPQTRIKASEWVYLNIPYGSKLLNEQWDDGLPIPIYQFSPGQYQITSLAMYDEDNADKINYLSNNLTNADYLILNSRRLYGTLIHLTDKYPITSGYYKLLFSGKLGYKIAAEFSSYPSFLGLTINDDKSEETFQVYDHPKVIIFKNEKHFSKEDLEKILKS